ncbi:hypothetical protein Pst134EA_007044 [Puccinia striiformis f. sp. tritici]|uniref:Uncharacterized protein n=1 Tax=Puccinia striiformis f. sp. tritici PST-78 TaxID=1165861 RepID=A0A0L0VK91_9BASI|nr:hypothetical protein Pst134EA_007044 [Puccinia striiformis f. sp. tritici]KAH9469767.1 hypothetical protein Pst134EA_007044 [Puccinia striiformis f. sp. tritici]KNE99404.1 hypothetical protein PSTG_07334 [Puccinia striiformis f. sp. tritici PST-78]
MNLDTCLFLILASFKVTDANDDFNDVTFEQLLELSYTQPSASDFSDNTIRFSKPHDYSGLWGSQVPYSADSIAHERYLDGVLSPKDYSTNFHQPTVNPAITGRSIDFPLRHWDEQPTSAVSPGKLVTENLLQGAIAASESDKVNAGSTGQLFDLWGESSPTFMNDDIDFGKLDAELSRLNKSPSSPSPEASFDYQCFVPDPVTSFETTSITPSIAPQKIQADGNSGMGVKTQGPQYEFLTHTYSEANELPRFFASSTDTNGKHSPKRSAAEFIDSPPLLQPPYEPKEKSLKNDKRPRISTNNASIKISKRATSRKKRAKLPGSIQIVPENIIITGKEGAQRLGRNLRAEFNSICRRIVQSESLTPMEIIPTDSLKRFTLIDILDLNNLPHECQENLRKVLQIRQAGLTPEPIITQRVSEVLRQGHKNGWGFNARDYRLVKKLQYLIVNSDVWYHYWLAQTNIDFRIYNQGYHVDQKSKLPAMLPAFLISVEMILTVMFWPASKNHNEMPEYTEEMKKAADFFKQFSLDLMNIRPQEQEAKDWREEKLIHLKSISCTMKGLQRLLWGIVELWAESTSRVIWNNLAIKDENVFNRNAKGVFNHIFLNSMEEITRNLKSQISLYKSKLS